MGAVNTVGKIFGHDEVSQPRIDSLRYESYLIEAGIIEQSGNQPYLNAAEAFNELVGFLARVGVTAHAHAEVPDSLPVNNRPDLFLTGNDREGLGFLFTPYTSRTRINTNDYNHVVTPYFHDAKTTWDAGDIRRIDQAKAVIGPEVDPTANGLKCVDHQGVWRAILELDKGIIIRTGLWFDDLFKYPESGTYSRLKPNQPGANWLRLRRFEWQTHQLNRLNQRNTKLANQIVDFYTQEAEE